MPGCDSLAAATESRSETAFRLPVAVPPVTQAAANHSGDDGAQCGPVSGRALTLSPGPASESCRLAPVKYPRYYPGPAGPAAAGPALAGTRDLAALSLRLPVRY